tara:strand:+ start:683 stop:847 length:165 start_codon:yes stop_codon:yes gene_type:complete
MYYLIITNKKKLQLLIEAFFIFIKIAFLIIERLSNTDVRKKLFGQEACQTLITL